MPTKDERIMAMLIYVTSFFTTFIGPLVIWLIKKDESAFVDFHGKEYFNFIISYFIYTVISGILVLLLVGFLLLWALGILFIVFQIVGAIKAYEGQLYRFPFIIRFFQ